MKEDKKSREKRCQVKEQQIQGLVINSFKYHKGMVRLRAKQSTLDLTTKLFGDQRSFKEKTETEIKLNWVNNE